MSDIPTLQWLVDWANVGVVIALAASLIAGGASIFLSKRLGTLRDEQSAHEKRASDEKVAGLEKEAAEAKRAYLELQERTKQRHLTTEQRTRLLEILKANPNKGPIELGCPINNAEACSFAEEFRDVLRAAGWTVTGLGYLPLPAKASGIILELRDAAKAPLRAGALAEALQSVGAEGPLTVSPNPNVDGEYLSLIVGTKP